MPKRPRRSRDPVQAAHQAYLEIIGETPRQLPPVPDGSPVAVAKRKGAGQGGQKRAKQLTPERRREIAQKAAKARWHRNQT
ncbi:MAG TPA: histone H1 [Thermoanaerobaculia bacterium]|nr:histone H1 [Thermoanaerobaculia bacterium]